MRPRQNPGGHRMKLLWQILRLTWWKVLPIWLFAVIFANLASFALLEPEPKPGPALLMIFWIPMM